MLRVSFEKTNEDTSVYFKDKVKKYMIETYERFDFIAETAEGMYLYDENGTRCV